MKNKKNNMMYAIIAVVVVVVAGAAAYMYYGGGYSYTAPGASGYTQTVQNAGGSDYTPGKGTTALTVNTASGSAGTYLVDGNGMTLYYFTKDTQGASPVSACSGACLAKWPIFYASSWTLPAGLNSADFTSFTRADGAVQSAYKGWPLYYYSGDAKAGDTNGQGFNGVWYVVAA